MGDSTKEAEGPLEGQKNSKLIKKVYEKKKDIVDYNQLKK